MMMQSIYKSTRCSQRIYPLASIQTMRHFRFSDDAAQTSASASASSEAASTSSAGPQPAAGVPSSQETAAEAPSSQEIGQASNSVRYRESYRHQRYGSGPREPGFRPPRRYPVRITNLTQSVTRSDVARFFSRFNITENDVRPEFQPQTLQTEAWWILFHNDEDRTRAAVLQRSFLVLFPSSAPWGTHRALIRPINNEAYMYEHLRTPLAMHSKGRTVLVDNLEMSTSLSGIIRHFEGYEMQGNAASIINSGKRTREDSHGRYDDMQRYTASQQLQNNNALATNGPNQQQTKASLLAAPSLRAVVRFATSEEAQRAVRNRNFTYLGNRRVKLRVLP